MVHFPAAVRPAVCSSSAGRTNNQVYFPCSQEANVFRGRAGWGQCVEARRDREVTPPAHGLAARGASVRLAAYSHRDTAMLLYRLKRLVIQLMLLVLLQGPSGLRPPNLTYGSISLSDSGSDVCSNTSRTRQ